MRTAYSLSAIVLLSGCMRPGAAEGDSSRRHVPPPTLLFDKHGHPLAEEELAAAAHAFVPAPLPREHMFAGCWYLVSDGVIVLSSERRDAPAAVEGWMADLRWRVEQPARKRRYYDLSGRLLKGAESVDNGYVFILAAGDAGSWGGLGQWYAVVGGVVDVARPSRTAPDVVLERMPRER